MGEVSQEDTQQLQRELRRLRGEVRETRDLASAILMAMVGDKALTWKIEARVERHIRAEAAGPPLREVVRYSIAERIWDEFEIAGARGLRRLRRDEVASLPGVGPVSMAKLDAALVAEGAEWGDWV